MKNIMLSLQQYCLNEIIRNFDLYNLAYLTTEDKSLKFKFEFLQRAYSFEIVSQLNENCFVKEEYADFVINKHLKTLYTCWLYDFSWETVVRKFTEIGHNLEKVIIKGADKPWENVICHLTNLKSLSYVNNCSDEILHAVSTFCPKIETIDVKYSRVSDDGIVYLCHNQDGEVPCPAIEELEICGTCIGDHGVKYLLKHLPSIKKIDYKGVHEVLYSIHQDDFDNLASVKPYNLTHLNLNRIDSPMGKEILEVCISVCPYLESISLFVFTQEQLDVCSRLVELKELCLDCLTEHPLSINDILNQKGSKLLDLKLRNFSISVSTLAKRCPRLTSLILEKVTFECNDNQSVPVLSHLEKICFDKLTLTDTVTIQAVIDLLSSSPTLKHLYMKYCEVPLSIKNHILKCSNECKLEHADFSFSDVEFGFVQNLLLTCSSLEDLNLDGCETNFSETDMEELEMIAYSLPNHPLIIYTDHYFHNYIMSDSDEYYNEFYDDEDYDDSDQYDCDYDDDDDENEDGVYCG